MGSEAGFHCIWVLQQKRKRVLPEISPTATAFPVIEMRKEGVAIYLSQDGLQCDPVHPAIKMAICCSKVDPANFLLPVSIVFIQSALCLPQIPVALDATQHRRFLIRGAFDDDVFAGLSGSKRFTGEADSPNRLHSIATMRGNLVWREVLDHCFRPIEVAIAYKFKDGRKLAHRLLPVSSDSEHKITGVVWPVAAFIVLHLRLDDHAVFVQFHPMRERCPVIVVSQAVSRAAVDRECGGWHEGDCGGRDVRDSYTNNLDFIFCYGTEDGDLRSDAGIPIIPDQGMREECAMNCSLHPIVVFIDLRELSC